MDVYAVNRMFEQIDGDDNDVDVHGMDANTRKRLKVGRLMQRKKTKPQKPVSTKLPYSLANIPKLQGESMSKLRKRGYIEEAGPKLKMTPGKFALIMTNPNHNKSLHGEYDTVEEAFKEAKKILARWVQDKTRAKWSVSVINVWSPTDGQRIWHRTGKQGPK